MAEREEGQASRGDPSALGALVLRMQADSVAAWQEFLRTYEPHIRHVAVRVLHHRLQSKLDASDLTQEVWEAFFDLDDWSSYCGSPEQLIAYLVGMAEKQMAQIVRAELGRQKRDVRREQSLEALRSADTLPAREGLPEEQAEMHELLRELLHVKPQSHRQVIWRRYCGESCQKIADELDMPVYKVRRILKHYDPRRKRSGDH